MKIEELKINKKVVDTWYSPKDYKDSWGIGIIKNISKTRVYIEFNNAKQEKDRFKTYDYAHCRHFLIHADLRKPDIKEKY